MKLPNICNKSGISEASLVAVGFSPSAFSYFPSIRVYISDADAHAHFKEGQLIEDGFYNDNGEIEILFNSNKSSMKLQPYWITISKKVCEEKKLDATRRI